MKFISNKKIKRLAFCLALFFYINNVIAQRNYFQQEVNYQISVKLNDNNHSLTAFEKIKYINNSDQKLEFIYFHLWPNAYKNKKTALSKQFLNQNKTAFYFAKDSELGFIDSLNFKVNNQSIKWEYDKLNPDICKLILNTALLPKDSIEISTPFFVKIPSAKFSRLGHSEQAYFITQWYPKPAVFDNEGWHPMPYLDQGEFYSEFGSFEVNITLPENYLLCATGNRVNAEAELDFLNSKIIESQEKLKNIIPSETNMNFPVSALKFKTITFKQNQIHDFAWFADKRFLVLKGEVVLPISKKTIDTWAYFTPKNANKWVKSINYINAATLFYSNNVAEYPYQHITAVDGTIMAGGGMEYPNITVIGDVTTDLDLDVVIAHEIGHNWFYGILGSNERDHPFLDEGINSFYEMQYVREKYPEKKLTEYINRDSSFKLLGLNKVPYWKEKEFAYLMSLKWHTDQSLDLTSEQFTVFNYGSIVYSKTPVVLDYLMSYLGKEKFDKAIKYYYEQFKFKHPSPKDFLNCMSLSSGFNLTDFDANLFKSTNHIDYKIKRVNKTKNGDFSITIKNKSNNILPFNLSGFKNNNLIDIKWIDGFKKTKTFYFPPLDFDYFKIDGFDQMPDINRKNNIVNAHGLFKKFKPLQLSFISHFENSTKTQIHYLPLLGANYYNGFMVGLGIHNYNFYQNRFDFAIAPMYAFNSKSLAGFTEFNFNCYKILGAQQISIGLKTKSFAYNYFNTKNLNQENNTSYQNLYLNYYKISPYIQIELKKINPTSLIKQIINYTNNNLFIDSLNQESLTNYSLSGPLKKTNYSFVNQLNYNLNNIHAIHPFNLNLNLQHTSTLLKLSLTLNYNIKINQKNVINIRWFAGKFFAGNNSERNYYAFRSTGFNGNQDYLFENQFIARNETSGFGFSQLAEKDGNLKIWTPLGQSKQWLTAINLKSPKLLKLPIKIFADIVFCDQKELNRDSFLWDTGLNVSIIKDIIDIYIPLAFNNDIKSILEKNNINFFNRIRFTLNIHKLVAKDLIKNNLF